MQNTVIEVKHKTCTQCIQRHRTDGLCKGLKYNKLSMLGISHNNESLGVFEKMLDPLNTGYTYMLIPIILNIE